MSQKLTLSKVLFLVLVMNFMVLSFWGIAQNKVLLSDEQLREIIGGASVSLSQLSTTWVPKGQPTNNTANITVTISGGPSNGYVNFTLSDVSDWAGYCMNAGTQSDSDKDLKLNTAD